MAYHHDNDITGREDDDASLYHDAYYREAAGPGEPYYGYRPAQYNARVSAPPREASTPRGGRRRGVFPLLITLVGVIAALCAAGLLLYFRGEADAADDAGDGDNDELFALFASTAAADESALPILLETADGREPMTASELFDAACDFSVGVIVADEARSGFGRQGALAVTGCGVVLSEDGYILTNYHLVRGAYELGVTVRVVTAGDAEYEAAIVGVDMDSDLAVLYAEGIADVETAPLGNSNELAVGQDIYTLATRTGALLGVIPGVVSALDRSVQTFSGAVVSMFQIDASADSEAGSPVLNDRGQVVGIMTMQYTQTGLDGLGFAIPICDACDIASDLVEYGCVTGRAYLGLSTMDVSPGAARFYGLVPGVYVYAVEAGSSAESAGLQVGDVITAIDGEFITSVIDLTAAIRRYSAGDTAELSIVRGDTAMTAWVVFDEARPDPGESLRGVRPGLVLYW